MESQTSQNVSPHVDITAQGHLLTVSPVHAVVGKFRRGDRKASNEFTQRSRLNLLHTFARIKAPNAKGYRSKVSLVTLTMREVMHARDAKVKLFTFLKRWRRKYPTLSGIWKLEYQKRGAPHFHMILYNAGYISKDDIRKSWGEVIGQQNPFTRIERIKNYRQGVSYVAKYLGKVDDTGFNNASKLTVDKETGEVTERSIGRRWGIFNRNWVPWDDETTATIDLDGSWWLIRRYCAQFWDVLEEREYLGFKLFHDNPTEALEHIVSLSKQFTSVDA